VKGAHAVDDHLCIVALQDDGDVDVETLLVEGKILTAGAGDESSEVVNGPRGAGGDSAIGLQGERAEVDADGVEGLLVLAALLFFLAGGVDSHANSSSGLR